MRLPLLFPSFLSAARLLLSPVAAAAILHRQWETAVALTVAAGFSDAADGWVARRWKLVTRIGAWLDPVADKMFAASVFVSLAVVGVLPVWLVALVFGRDVLILLMAGYALCFTAMRDFPPTFSGKLSTLVQVAAAVIAMASNAWPAPGLDALLRAAIGAAALATIWSGAHYVWIGWKRLRSSARPRHTLTS